MNRPLTLAFSPCPNDTYVFGAFAQGLLDGEAPSVRPQLDDIENLNKSALKGDYEITKASYGAIPMLMESYRILRAGGALGRGCGPLLVARSADLRNLEDLQERLIAIPGEMTTAYMLLRLAMPVRAQTFHLRFDRIVDAIAEGIADAGLLIHEARFTYEGAGLHTIIDLGEWWESQTGFPLPLGAVLVRNDVEDGCAREIDASIRQSLRYARDHDDETMQYVRAHSAAIQDDVLRRHIQLYVNGFTEDVGETGEAAVRELFARANAAGIVRGTANAAFV